jgi:hypothetical protein
MDPSLKIQLKSDITLAKTFISTAGSQWSPLNMTTYPVTGNVVTITSLTSAAICLKAQGDALARIADVLDKMIDNV